nr:helix-turn-helix transcriptional regulator [Rhodoblastus acidophilus]
MNFLWKVKNQGFQPGCAVNARASRGVDLVPGRENRLSHRELRVSIMSDVNPIDKHVGARLRALREARGFSAEALVRPAGLSIDRLERLEDGRERISVDDMRRLCEVLGATPADFFRGLNEERPNSGPTGGDLSIEEEGRLLLADFRAIEDARKRRMLLMIAAAFAREK